MFHKPKILEFHKRKITANTLSLMNFRGHSLLDMHPVNQQITKIIGHLTFRLI